jgi:FkbM family methyltransferase
MRHLIDWSTRTLVALSCTLLMAQTPVPKVKAGPAPGESPVKLIRKDAAAKLELYDTQLGPVWLPAPGEDLIRLLQWEQVSQKIYTHSRAQVRPGDVVIDCGAHVGMFTRLALRLGAGLVVAVEPERTNLLALERNFAAEIKAGSVRLVPKGVWDAVGKLNLRLSTMNTGSHSLVFDKEIAGTEVIDVTTIDQMVESMKLKRVDFIKMDIEGSERHALLGGRKVIQNWRPRLAIASYHLKGDPAAIAEIIWSARPDYLVASKDLELPGHGTVVPKVLFFF